MTPRLYPAAYAGISYPSNPKKLLPQFRELLDHRAPPLPPRPSRGAVSPILIVPHIDFRVNLSLYAQTFARLLRAKQFPKTVYLLGVAHRCPHEFSLAPVAYETPLGRAPVAANIISEIQQNCPFNIARSPAAFRAEHSLEFPLVWLQTVRDLYFPDQPFAVVPVLFGGMYDTVTRGRLPSPRHEITRFGAALAAAYNRHAAGEALIVASIDGCHVGPRFGHDFPVTLAVAAAVKKWEDQLWRLCRSDRLPQFVNHLYGIRNAFYFDGVGVLLWLLRNFNLRAIRETAANYFEKTDHSLVTFSAGHLKKLPSPALPPNSPGAPAISSA